MFRLIPTTPSPFLNFTIRFFVVISIPTVIFTLYSVISDAPITYACINFLNRPLYILGFSLYLSFLLHLFGMKRRSQSIALVVWVLALALFACLAIYSSNFLSETKGNYSVGLKEKINDEKNWGDIRNCLVVRNDCSWMKKMNRTWDEFVKVGLSPIESGCCKPPSECNFTYRSATAWDKPSGFTNTSTTTTDCNTWDNDQSKLCFDCDSCKAGVIAEARVPWKLAATFCIVVLSYLIIASFVIVYCICWKFEKSDCKGERVPSEAEKAAVDG